MKKPYRLHGTIAAYRRHYRHGEEPCPACREANRIRCLWKTRERNNTPVERYQAS